MSENDPAVEKNGKLEHDQAKLQIGEIAMHATEQLVNQIPEISPERQSTFVEKNPDGTYYLFCGDDRNLTIESAEHLRQIGIEDPDTAIRYYGGIVGITRVYAVAFVLQHGIEALAALGDLFPDEVKEQKARITNSQKVLAGTHSAESNENDSASLNPESDSDIGCKYAAAVQTVTILNSEPDVITTGKSESTRLTGQDLTDQIAQANAQVANLYSKNGQTSFNLVRHDLIDLDGPVAIVAGSHAPIDEVVAVCNFYPNKVSNPRQANDSGVSFYNNDMTQVAEMIIRANPDADLDPRILLAVMDQDIRATREALASAEGKHAADLRLERYGTYEDAVAYLESIKVSV